MRRPNHVVEHAKTRAAINHGVMLRPLRVEGHLGFAGQHQLEGAHRAAKHGKASLGNGWFATEPLATESGQGVIDIFSTMDALERGNVTLAGTRFRGVDYRHALAEARLQQLNGQLGPNRVGWLGAIAGTQLPVKVDLVIDDR